MESYYPIPAVLQQTWVKKRYSTSWEFPRWQVWRTVLFRTWPPQGRIASVMFSMLCHPSCRMEQCWRGRRQRSSNDVGPGGLQDTKCSCYICLSGHPKLGDGFPGLQLFRVQLSSLVGGPMDHHGAAGGTQAFSFLLRVHRLGLTWVAVLESDAPEWLRNAGWVGPPLGSALRMPAGALHVRKRCLTHLCSPAGNAVLRHYLGASMAWPLPVVVRGARRCMHDGQCLWLDEDDRCRTTAGMAPLHPAHVAASRHIVAPRGIASPGCVATS